MKPLKPSGKFSEARRTPLTLTLVRQSQTLPSPKSAWATPTDGSIILTVGGTIVPTARAKPSARLSASPPRLATGNRNPITKLSARPQPATTASARPSGARAKISRNLDTAGQVIQHTTVDMNPCPIGNRNTGGTKARASTTLCARLSVTISAPVGYLPPPFHGTNGILNPRSSARSREPT